MDVRYQAGTNMFNYRAAGILFENGHVLLHKHIDDDHWVLPGGGIEMGESSQACIVREIKEELGYNVTVKHIPWIAENFFQHHDRTFHELGFYYALEADASHFYPEVFHGLEGDALLYKWVPIEQLEEYWILPAFLNKGLKQLPTHTKHVIVQDGES